MSDFILCEYQLTCTAEEAEAQARELALEQTVEVPEALVTDPAIRDGVIGRVERIEENALGDGVHRVTVAYHAWLANGQLPQLLNLLFGNISIKGNIRLIGLNLPKALLDAFRGARFGVEGVRALLGVYGRPLLATALKPRGLDNAGLARIAGDFVRGGGDIVKDDHNLADDDYESFCKRVLACHEAAVAANEETGRNGQYFPSLMAPAPSLEKYAEYLVKIGVKGVLVSPALIGYDAVRHLAETCPLVYMAHPAFSGSFYANRTHGIAPEVLLGTLFRLMGCDMSVFPNHGGRFGLTRDECVGIQSALQEPLGNYAPAWPAPAGGMSFDKLPSMAEAYGADSVFLVGGALLSHGADLAQSTRAYLGVINEHFEEELHEPVREWTSSCEMPSGNSLNLLHHLRVTGDLEWEGRPATVYKDDETLPFAGVKRVELVGKAGEASDFELRYFELEPGGYTSFERHAHSHTVIGVRGEGTVVRNESKATLKVNEIAYIGPLEPHQLRNEGEAPFGFYCIVDRERDRPMEA